MPKRHFLLITFTPLLLFSLLPTSIPSTSATPAAEAEDDEDLSFLEEPENDAVSRNQESYAEKPEFESYDDKEFESYDDFYVPSSLDHDEIEEEIAKFDESDVVVLTNGNFSDFLEENKYVVVEFYAPWCKYSKALTPEYAAAATELKSVNVNLAKVSVTEDYDLAWELGVQGYPTVLFFVDGKHTPYLGGLCQGSKDAIVTWINEKTGPRVSNITTTEDAERILMSENNVVLSFLDSLEGPDSEEFAAASNLDDNVNFYQTVNPNVAKMFHLPPDVKRPAMLLLKKEVEKVTRFDGQFQKSEISEFVSANKLPLVTTFSRGSASLIFESPIKKQLLLFATSNGSEKILQTFEQAAMLFKGKLIFVYVETDNEEVGKPVADYFGVTGDDPKVSGYAGNDDTKKYVLRYARNDDAKKYVLDGEVTLEKIKSFGEDFVHDKLKPFYKSDPIPETNDGDVKIVVGNNFDEIVLDESKDVLLEIYNPWCDGCQSFELTYNKLAKHLRGIKSLIVAKMDGTTNVNPKAKVDSCPTILFFPAGKKSLDPISVDAERTVVALYKFLKKHASIPFKLEKTVSSPASEDSTTKQDTKSTSIDVKDEM